MRPRVIQQYLGVDLSSASGRALVEERYWSLRRQVPIIYLLGLVNLSAMEIAAGRSLKVGLNLPTFILLCALIRLRDWFGAENARKPTHEMMVKRLTQTVFFAAAVCLAVCARCLYLLQVGDTASHMAVILFGGLTAIGVAYGLTALPAAGRIPLLLIIGPISIVAALSNERQFVGAAFGLVVVAALTMRLLSAHSSHFTTVVHSRARIASEQQRAEHAREEAMVAATTDFLTGLPNRRALVAALQAATEERPGRFSLAILDLDRFKTVNDTFGHLIGDKLLEEVAARLVRAVGNSGLVARLGGDEFGVLLHHIHDHADVERTGFEIIAGVNGPAILDDREFTVSASCGLAISQKSRERSPSRLIADADLALYQAKDNPGGGVAVFAPRMEAPRRRRAEIERALQLPGLNANLRLVYQPIFDLRSGRVIAHEALARWNDPELGDIAPSEFVPLAEQLGIIGDLDRHLMSIAFDQARNWPDDVKLSFNLSALQLCSLESSSVVLQALAASGIDAVRLQVEVTETALMADVERARDNLTQLKSAGATIVLDDFGAGYASLGYLRQLSFDQIKLDGDLVTAAQHSQEGKRLLRAVIGLCEILGVSSVAEHVESEQLLALVLELGCAAAQGFWLEKPLSADEISRLYSGSSGMSLGYNLRAA
nr:EAL domain-containing protein [Sphingomonas sp.]